MSGSPFFALQALPSLEGGEAPNETQVVNLTLAQLHPAKWACEPDARREPDFRGVMSLDCFIFLA